MRLQTLQRTSTDFGGNFAHILQEEFGNYKQNRDLTWQDIIFQLLYGLWMKHSRMAICLRPMSTSNPSSPSKFQVKQLIYFRELDDGGLQPFWWKILSCAPYENPLKFGQAASLK